MRISKAIANLAGDGEKRLQAAQSRLDREQAAWRDFSTREPYESMRAELETLTGSHERVNRDLLDSRAELAELKGSADVGRMAGVQARVDALAKQDAELSRETQAKGAALSGEEAQADQLEQRLQSARTEYDAAAARLGELRAADGSRGERLRVMDPGVTPERPSSPNVALNVLLGDRRGSTRLRGLSHSDVPAAPAMIAVLSADRRQWAAGAFIVSYAAAIALVRGPAQYALAAALVMVPLLYWVLVSSSAWLTAFFAIALLAPPLPIAFGNSGPHPALLLAALGAAAGLVRLREWRFQRGLLPGALIFFFAMLAISLVPAALYSGSQIALASLARVGLAGISLYVFFYVCAGPGRAGEVSIRLLYWAAVASAAFACVDFFYQFPAPAGFGPQYIWLSSGIYRRAQGLFL